MLFSIITINYNDKIGLHDTINSVIKQTYQDFEYIVIDGDSTDGSKEIISRHKAYISYAVSEPDTGIYNAMNKGIRASKGDYLFFLNSGDLFHNDEVLSVVSQGMLERCDIYYGNLQFLNSKEVVYCPEELTFSYFYKQTLPHQATFIKRTLFDQVFYYNENLKIVSDWEFFICAVCKYSATYKYINLITSNYNLDGFSSDPSNKNLFLQERKLCLKNHFSYFIDDFEELQYFKIFFRRRRFKLLIALEEYKIARKLNSLWLIFLSMFFSKK